MDAAASPPCELHPMVWRTTRTARLGSSLLGVLASLLGLALMTGYVRDTDPSTPRWQDAAFGALLVVGSIAAPWLLAFKPYVALDTAYVTVVNPLRTVRLPLPAVRATTRNAKCVVVRVFEHGEFIHIGTWAVQKAPLMDLLGKTTRADRVALAISDAADSARRDVG